MVDRRTVAEHQLRSRGTLPKIEPMPRSYGSVAPRLLDPILAVVERIDRTIRRIRPVGPDALLGLERHRHRGDAFTLADGTRVRPGDPAWIIHFDNGRLRRLVPKPGGPLTDAWSAARRDMVRISVAHAAMAPGDRPIAYTGISILAPLAHRGGFELRPRRRTAWVRLEDWYLRSVLARWAAGGRARLGRGHRPLVTAEVWMSGAELMRRYGSSPPPPE